jgi:branched-chain amino acid transport system ATP-binding protein
MGELLRLEHLEVSYGAIKAVRDLSLTVDEGEIVALLGPNGAGKSSTLGGIAGLERVTAGRIVLNGEDIRNLSPERRVERGIALAPEGRRIFTSLTVEENLRLGGKTRRGHDRYDEVLEGLLELFPVLRSRYASLASGLSGGEQQQLALARALMSQPRLLLLDEPSLGLGPRIVEQVFDVIGQLRGRGVTVLLVEQQVDRALGLADRAYVLVSGSLQLQGSAREVREKGDLALAYLGSAA